MVERVTALTTTGVLGLAAVKSFRNPGQVSAKIREIKNLERAILSVATGQYVITLALKDKSRIQRWRYLDWLITTPMLLKTFHSLAEEKGYKGSFLPALIFDIIMVYAGYHAEFLAKSETERNIFYILGVIALVVIFYYVKEWEEYLASQDFDTKHISTFFYIGWSIYGVNFLTPNAKLRQTGFNILDLFNKGFYSFHLDSVLERNFGQ